MTLESPKNVGDNEKNSRENIISPLLFEGENEKDELKNKSERLEQVKKYFLNNLKSKRNLVIAENFEKDKYNFFQIQTEDPNSNSPYCYIEVFLKKNGLIYGKYSKTKINYFDVLGSSIGEHKMIESYEFLIHNEEGLKKTISILNSLLEKI